MPSFANKIVLGSDSVAVSSMPQTTKNKIHVNQEMKQGVHHLNKQKIFLQQNNRLLLKQPDDLQLVESHHHQSLLQNLSSSIQPDAKEERRNSPRHVAGRRQLSADQIEKMQPGVAAGE